MKEPRFHNLYNEDKKQGNKHQNIENSQDETYSKTTITYTSGDKFKSWFSVVFVALAILTFIPGVIILNSTDGRGWFLYVCAFLFIGIAGFPWAWPTFWGFWRDSLYGVSFNIFHFYGILSIIGLVLDLVFFIAKWLLLPSLCLALGWIFMLFHIPTIVRTVRNVTG